MSTDLMIPEDEKKREISPEIWGMLNAIVKTTSAGSSNRLAMDAKKVLFAYENGLNLNLAFNGGLYVTPNGRMEVEGIVIRSKLEVTKGYHLKIDRQDNTGCELSLWRIADETWPVKLYDDKAKNGDWVLYGQASFTEDDAQLAGLLTSNKDTYKKYPSDMYLNRATSRIYKRYLSSLFNGAPVYVRGEVQGLDFDDSIEGEFSVEDEPEMTLNDLKEKYGFTVKQILEANNGSIPANSAEVKAVYEKLNGGESND